MNTAQGVQPAAMRAQHVAAEGGRIAAVGQRVEAVGQRTANLERRTDDVERTMQRLVLQFAGLSLMQERLVAQDRAIQDLLRPNPEAAWKKYSASFGAVKRKKAANIAAKVFIIGFCIKNLDRDFKRLRDRTFRLRAVWATTEAKRQLWHDPLRITDAAQWNARVQHRADELEAERPPVPTLW